VYLRFGLFVFLTFAVSACARPDDNYIVPLGHPAGPESRPGAVLTGSDALEPELRTVKPRLTPSAAPKPAPSSGAQQHKH